MVLIFDFVPICREYQRIYVLALVVSSLFSDCEFEVPTDRNKCNRPLTILQYSVTYPLVLFVGRNFTGYHLVKQERMMRP
jgi:hypothetical protein